MIRPCTARDVDAVARIWLECSCSAHAFIPRAHWEARLEDLRGRYLPLSETVLFVDDDTGRIVGFMALIESYLAALFVAPSHQGRGIGSRLLELAVRMHPDLDLTVYAQNTRAVRFYRRHGFVCAQRRVEAATGCEEWVMMREDARGCL